MLTLDSKSFSPKMPAPPVPASLQISVNATKVEYVQLGTYISEQPCLLFLQASGLESQLLRAERSTSALDLRYDPASCPEKAMLTPKFA